MGPTRQHSRLMEMRYMNTPNEKILLPGPDHSLLYLVAFRFKRETPTSLSADGLLTQAEVVRTVVAPAIIRFQVRIRGTQGGFRRAAPSGEDLQTSNQFSLNLRRGLKAT